MCQDQEGRGEEDKGRPVFDLSIEGQIRRTEWQMERRMMCQDSQERREEEDEKALIESFHGHIESFKGHIECWNGHIECLNAYEQGKVVRRR